MLEHANGRDDDERTPRVLHISDVHAGPDELSTTASGIAEAVKNNIGGVRFIVVSGDLGLRGRDQERGAKFVVELSRELGIPEARRICCAGNHDIQTDRPSKKFETYAAAVYGIGRQSRYVGDAPVTYYESDGVEFLLINSAYHGDHRYGKVDLHELRTAVRSFSGRAFRIAVVHHHIIPIDERDPSTIVNAYECVKILTEAGTDVLLHGHRHSALTITIERMRVFGVGTVSFRPLPNLNNQFNVLELGQRITRFRYIADAHGRYQLGAWVPESQTW